MAEGKCHPQPGDLIEIDRTGYQHWALYMGDGYVINVTPVGKACAAWQSAEWVLGCPRIPVSFHILLLVDPVYVDDLSRSRGNPSEVVESPEKFFLTALCPP